MTADIAISTYKQAGIARLAKGFLIPIAGVRYVISWQNHENAPIPEVLSKRDDVTILRFDGDGQSNNRNNALLHCTSDIVIISDDDLIYREEGIRQLIRKFEEFPEMEVATFRSVHDAEITYPGGVTSLSTHLPKGYYISCIEIALRRNSRAGLLRFNPELGLNSPRMHGGEDEIFVFTAIKRGLDCRFLPITVCEHPHSSTGLKRSLTPANIRAMGCVIRLHHPLSFIPRIFLKAWRLSRKKQSSFFKAIRFLTGGAIETPAFKKRTASYF